MMAAHGWEEDQRRTLARAATMTGGAQFSESGTTEFGPTREYIYD